MPQDDIFLKKEGDNWFQRNRDALHEQKSPDPALSLMQLYKLKPRKVLEVGASNGWRLAKIAELYSSACVGVDPSAEAIKDGKKRYSHIVFKRGIASDIPLKTKFDLVIVNYVLHWVSRDELLKATSEIDRMVADGGYLIIGDFAPDYPTKTKYHHLPKEKVFTYKLDYAGIFTATALYKTVASMTFEHQKNRLLPDVSGKDRGIVSLLNKSLSDFYCT